MSLKLERVTVMLVTKCSWHPLTFPTSIIDFQLHWFFPNSIKTFQLQHKHSNFSSNFPTSFFSIFSDFSTSRFFMDGIGFIDFRWNLVFKKILTRNNDRESTIIEPFDNMVDHSICNFSNFVIDIFLLCFWITTKIQSFYFAIFCNVIFFENAKYSIFHGLNLNSVKLVYQT